jgi:hypothetical protein
VRIPAPDPAPSTGLPHRLRGPAARSREAPPATNTRAATRAAVSTDATGTAHRGPSPCKTEADPAPTTAAVPEAFTDPAPATGPVKVAADIMTVTDQATDTDPDTAGAVGLTEPAASGSTAALVEISEGAGEEGGGPGSGGRYRHGHS